MPAQVIQTNNSPFTNVSVDAVTLDIIENALRMRELKWMPFFFELRCPLEFVSNMTPSP